MKKRILAGGLGLALILSLAACGGGSEGELAALQKEKEAILRQAEQWEETCRGLTGENERLTALNAELELGAQSDTASAAEENVIDRFFDGVEFGSSTAEMDFVANCQADAWENEAQNAAERLKEQLPLAEDQKLVDDFLAAAGEQADRLHTMAIYPIADLEVPQEQRAASSGSLRGVFWAGSRAQLWRDTFFQLLYAMPEEYTYCFDSAAMLDKINSALSDG